MTIILSLIGYIIKEGCKEDWYIVKLNVVSSFDMGKDISTHQMSAPGVQRRGKFKRPKKDTTTTKPALSECKQHKLRKVVHQKPASCEIINENTATTCPFILVALNLNEIKSLCTQHVQQLRKFTCPRCKDTLQGITV